MTHFILQTIKSRFHYKHNDAAVIIWHEYFIFIFIKLHEQKSNLFHDEKWNSPADKNNEWMNIVFNHRQQNSSFITAGGR